MDNNVLVEGNLLLAEEEDSSVSSGEEEKEEIEFTEQINSIVNDDEEEEIEVFGKDDTTAQFSKPDEHKNKLSNAINVPQPQFHDEPEIVRDEFGLSYEKKSYPTWFDKNQSAEVVTSTTLVYQENDKSLLPEPPLPSVPSQPEDEDDEFAVVDTNHSPTNPVDESRVKQALEQLKLKSQETTSSDVNFEKELSEYAHNYGPSAQRNDAQEKALANNKLYTNTFNIFAGGRPLDSQGSGLADEPLVFLDHQPMDHLLPEDLPPVKMKKDGKISQETSEKDFMVDSKKALAEIVEVYGHGMGDQEVLLLDLMESEEEQSKGKQASLKKKKGPTKENEVRKTQTIAIDKTLNVIAEEDEEESDNSDRDDDEDLEEEVEIRIRQPGQRRPPTQQTDKQPVVKPSTLEEEWEAIVVDQSRSAANHSTSLSNQMKASSRNTDRVAQTYQKWNYADLLHYLQDLDLSAYESQIVISEKNPNEGHKGFFKSMFSSTSSASSSLSGLTFPDAERSLKFPFLLAQIDYDPFLPEHLNLLRTFYYSLLEVSIEEEERGGMVTAIDERWENLGFQGKDPRTDLNRAIKLLSLVQMLAFLESNPSLVKYLFQLSESAQSLALQLNQTGSRPAIREKQGFDHSWPFMCVAILISKEAIQCLRYGMLVEICNKKKNVLEAINLFHHACFAEFGRMLVQDPFKHHAMHLTTLREKCSKNPMKILKQYQENNDAIIDAILSNDYYMKIQRYGVNPTGSSSTSSAPQKKPTATTKAKKEEVIEAFDKFEEIEDNPSYVLEKSVEHEFAKSKTAKRFMVDEN